MQQQQQQEQQQEQQQQQDKKHKFQPCKRNCGGAMITFDAQLGRTRQGGWIPLEKILLIDLLSSSFFFFFLCLIAVLVVPFPLLLLLLLILCKTFFDSVLFHSVEIVSKKTNCMSGLYYLHFE
jgi:hypothetical protein